MFFVEKYFEFNCFYGKKKKRYVFVYIYLYIFYFMYIDRFFLSLSFFVFYIGFRFFKDGVCFIFWVVDIGDFV